MSTLTTEDLKILSSPFPADSVCVKVQSVSKDKTRAMLVLYLQHTDVYVRIEQVDPAWSCQVTHEEWKGEWITARMRMTIKGVSRENGGEGQDAKSAYSDALKRCAMLFGVGRYLYDSEQVWIPYNEQQDRFKTYTMDDYNRGLRPNQERTPTAESEQSKEPIRLGTPFRPTTGAPKAVPITPSRTKFTVGTQIALTRKAMGITPEQAEEWGKDSFGKFPKDMSLEEMERFLSMLQEEAGRNGIVI